MSSIKYTIAGDDDDDGQRYYTRFPCLAMVRYAMAAAVTLLAVAVIALVIHAVLRSEDVRLSINNGYIGADNLWQQTVRPQKSAATSGINENLPATSSVNKAEAVEPAIGSSKDPDTGEGDLPESMTNLGQSIGGGLPRECNLGCSGESEGPPEEVTLKKANATNLRLILVARNPGGRTRIDCNGTTVRLVDAKPPNGAIVDTVTLGDFTVPPQTTITLQTRLRANASYIWDKYPGELRFSVQVQVNSSVTSFPLGKQQTTVNASYTCQPVTVGLMDSASEWIYATDQVECIRAAAA